MMRACTHDSPTTRMAVFAILCSLSSHDHFFTRKGYDL